MAKKKRQPRKKPSPSKDLAESYAKQLREGNSTSPAVESIMKACETMPLAERQRLNQDMKAALNGSGDQGAPKFAVGDNRDLHLLNANSSLERATGTEDLDFANHLIGQLNLASQGSTELAKRNVDALCAMMHGIGPQNELEAMLAAQMVTNHNLSMKFMARAADPEQTGYGLEFYTKSADRLMRTFTAQIEALTRLRGRGQQKITVEHVNVEPGGQAVVGVVEGGGGKNGN